MQGVTFVLFVKFTSRHTDDTNVIGETVDGTSVGAMKEKRGEGERGREWGREREREGEREGEREREKGREGGRV